MELQFEELKLHFLLELARRCGLQVQLLRRLDCRTLSCSMEQRSQIWQQIIMLSTGVTGDGCHNVFDVLQTLGLTHTCP